MKLHRKDGKLWFCTNNTKDVYKDMLENPEVEVSVSSPEYAWIRLHGKAVFENNMIESRSVYLSLGDRESKTRNPVMATVADCIRNCEKILKEQDVNTTLEWNQGNHFWLMFDNEKLIAFVDGFVTDEVDLIDEMYNCEKLFQEQYIPEVLL